MKNFSKSKISGIRKVLRFTNDRDTVQHILNVIGREYWDRDTLGSCGYSKLTDEQIALFDSLGGYYSSEEIDEMLYNDDINEEISDRLREQGVTPFLYQNEDYLNSIREGKVICEGIDVDEITSEYYNKMNNYINEQNCI